MRTEDGCVQGLNKNKYSYTLFNKDLEIMAKFIELEVNPFYNPHKCLINVDWIVDVVPNPQDKNTCIIYFGAKVDDSEEKEVVKGKYEDIKDKLLAL